MTHADKLAAALRALTGLIDFAESDGRGLSGDNADEYANVVKPMVCEALAEHDARTFASDCHDLADRARVIVRRNELAPSGQLHSLRMLEASAHAVGDNAECAPALYLEQ